MLFNSEASSLPNRRRLRKTIFVNENSTEIDSDNSQITEINTRNNYQDQTNQSKFRASLLQSTRSETDLLLLGQKRYSQVLQPSLSQQEEQQNLRTQFVSAPQSKHTHRYSLSSYDQMDDLFQSNNNRNSIQQLMQPVERRVSYNEYQVNAQQSQSKQPQLKNSASVHPSEEFNNQTNFANNSQYQKNYYYPTHLSQIDIRQSNKNNSSLGSNQANKNSLRGTQSGFFLKNQANIFQEDSTQNFLESPSKNALHNILSGTQKTYNYGQRYSQTKIKSLSNLSNTLRRIEELETNTSIKNDSNISIQKSERIIQFAKKHDNSLPNIYSSPIDLLKKQPSKGVLKNSSKTIINSQSYIENGEEDDSNLSSKENLNSKSLGNLRITRRTPSSLEEIPEVEINNYNLVNQNQIPIVQTVQPRVRKIIRNGTVIKKIQSDNYNDLSQQSEGVSPKKKQVSNIDLQSEMRQQDDVLSNNSSPKKRLSKIQIVQAII